MEDMATPQPSTLDQLGKMYSSYFRPDDVKVLATTTNCNREKNEKEKSEAETYEVFRLFVLLVLVMFEEETKVE